MGRVRIYFQGCHWSIQFSNYIPALSSEKTMNGYPKREKKCGLRIKYIVLKVIHSKVPSSDVIEDAGKK